MKYKQTTAKIFALETTNYCQSNCSYCPHKKMTRELGCVSMEVVDNVVEYMEKTGQTYLALHHMGEPLIHPIIGNIIWNFYKVGIKSEISTNGLLLEKKGFEILANKIRVVRVAVDSYYNTPGYIQRVQKFLELLKQFPDTVVRIHTVAGNDLSVFDKFVIPGQVYLENKTLDNWAGQVEGKSKMPKAEKCYFIDYNFVNVLWDGTVVQCCLDYDGKYKLGTFRHLENIKSNPKIELCKHCQKLQFPEGGEWKI